MSLEYMGKQDKQEKYDDYFLKYQYDNAIVIGDNKLKENIEILIGKRGIYCKYHDTRRCDQNCGHMMFALMAKELSKLIKPEKLR